MPDINYENDKSRQSSKFPCPSCGAVMTFNPEKGNLHCEFCQNNIDFDRKDSEIKEYDFFKVVDDKKEAQSSLTIKCQSCGAKTVINNDTMSKFCAFCGSSHIVSKDEMDGITPESVLPFEITEKKAKLKFKSWVKKRIWAPEKFRKQKDFAGKLNGVYVPYWTYDSDTYYHYTAQAGDYYYVTKYRTVNGKRESYQERKIRWRSVSGSGSCYFDDLQIQASKELNYDLLQKIEPFTLSKLTPYQKEFLSGFLAERYSVDVKEGWDIAKSEINTELHRMVRSSISADEVRNINIVANYKQVLYKHILVPVWLSAFKYKKKTYQYMINGENGKVSGKSPISVLKVIIAILMALGIIFGIYMLVKNGDGSYITN